jgi:TRAP-type C4-dicarboxylate transport system permease small subunit
MENRTAAIIATIATVLLCGCPGLGLCVFGAITATGNMPYTVTGVNGSTSSGTMPTTWGFAFLCVALIFILIPILVGFFTLRNKPAPAPMVPPSGPLPPAM